MGRYVPKHLNKAGQRPRFRFVSSWKQSRNRSAVNAVVLAVALLVVFYIWGNLGSSTAWFSENRLVQAREPQLQVETLPKELAHVKVYPLVELTDQLMTFDPANPLVQSTVELEDGTDFTSYPLPKYSFSDATTHYVLVEVQVPQGFPSVNLTVSTPLRELGQLSTDPRENPMSSVIEFIPCSADTAALTVQRASLPEGMRLDVPGGKTSLTLASGATGPAIYFLMHYSEDMIFDLYSRNIGNAILEVMDKVTYYMDFSFQLTGSETGI